MFVVFFRCIEIASSTSSAARSNEAAFLKSNCEIAKTRYNNPVDTRPLLLSPNGGSLIPVASEIATAAFIPLWFRKTLVSTRPLWVTLTPLLSWLS